MKRRVLVGVMAVSLGVVLFIPRETETVGTTEAVPEVVLPYRVQILLRGGLCDNIQSVFETLVRDFPHVLQPQRQEALADIEYYRTWLQRKNCG
jgi:hypothetical protein